MLETRTDLTIGTKKEMAAAFGFGNGIRLELYDVRELIKVLYLHFGRERTDAFFEGGLGCEAHEGRLGWGPSRDDAEWMDLATAEEEARRDKGIRILNTEENGREAGIEGCELGLYPAFELRLTLGNGETADPVSLGKLFPDCIVPELGCLVHAPKWWEKRHHFPRTVPHPR